MTKAWQTPPRALHVKGGRLTHGQLIKGATDMKTIPQRPLNTTYTDRIGRDGAPKNIVDAPIAHGMKRQTRGEFGFHHGVTVQDEPMTTKTFDASKPIAAHPGMTDRQVARHAAMPSANDVLSNAARLGKPAEKA
jgi:hypothetical protein